MSAIDTQKDDHVLSARELSILSLMADGLSNQEIADRLFLALTTVKWYIRQINEKLDTHTRKLTLARARELKLLSDKKAIPTVQDESPEPPDNPYKGLQAFQEVDAPDFFGREALVKRLLTRLSEVGTTARFLALVGPSGSGKSSVVQAGLIPALRQGRLSSFQNGMIVQITPGSHPLEELEIALLRIAPNPPSSLLPQLREDERGLLRAVRRVLPDNNSQLLLFIDQFEELFTLVANPQEREQFLDVLSTAVIDERSPLRIVITLRADFYDRPLLYTDFGELMRQRTEVVLPLTVTELEQTISRPAAQAGVTLESGLVMAIVTEADQQPGELPLLQYALTELFDYTQGREMTLASYRAIGGILGALARRADALYEALTDTGQNIVRQLFLRLVTLGEGIEDTRCRVHLTELLSLSLDANQLDDLIQTFAAYRLLTLDRDAVTRTATVELAHEALIREWQRLRSWLDESRADIRLQRLLAASAAEWRHAEQDIGFLMTGARLGQFEDWVTRTQVTLTANERAFLDASLTQRDRQAAAEQERRAREQKLERRSRNILRILVVVLLLATLGAFGLTSVAVNQSGIAQVERDSARRSAVEAQNVALTAGSQLAFAKGDSGLAIALAMEAINLDPNSARAQAVLSEAVFAPGTVRRFVGHKEAVASIAISPDGRTMISASDDKTLILWDVATGQIIRQFVGHTDKAITVAFSPDGRTILSGSNNFAGSKDTRLILWDVETGQIIRYFVGHTAGVWAVAFSPDGNTALSGGTDAIPILWDVRTGQIIRRLGADGSGHTDQVESVAISPDGRTALTGSWDTTLILWDLESGKVIRRMGASGEGHLNPVLKVVFSPDGRRALSGAQESTIILWDIVTGDVIRRLNDGQGWVFGLAFSPDGHTALSTGLQGTLTQWDMETGEIIQRLQGHAGPVVSVAFSPNGRTAISSAGVADHEPRLWDLEQGQIVRRFLGHVKSIIAVARSPDGRYVISAADDGMAILWDVDTGQEIWRYPALTWSADFAPDGKTALLATISIPSGERGDLVLVDTATGSEIRHFGPLPAGITSIAFSPDGRTAVSGGMGQINILWNVVTGQEIRHFTGYENNILDHSPEATHIVGFSPDGSQIFTALGNGVIVLWDAATGAKLKELSGGPTAWSYSIHGEEMLLGGTDGTVSIWNLALGSMVGHITPHTLSINVAQITPDGHFGISSSVDNTTTLWDLKTGEVLRRWGGGNNSAKDLAFSPNGRDAILGFGDGRVELWRVDATLDELLAWVKANRYIPELKCEQRELYRLEPLCHEPTPDSPSVLR